MIDLRSDSSSTPTKDMRKAMAEAEVGNDAFREDPTVNELERLAASLLGKEAALFVSSGTMGNILGLLATTSPGDAVLAGRQSHLIRFEAGAPARLGGVALLPFDDESGRLSINQLERFLNLPMSLRTRMLSIENTHNSSGGLALSLEEMAQYQAFVRKYDLHLHLDGARLFNAAIAIGVPAREIVRFADSVTFCLSKCLSAPIGSILVGKSDFINRARELRFQLGGQMRQAGIIAAAGLVALNSMMPQIEVDHDHARILAQGIAGIVGIGISPELVQSNIVLFDVSKLVSNAQIFEDRLEARGVFASVFSPHMIRFITYRDIDRDRINTVLEVTRDVARELQS